MAKKKASSTTRRSKAASKKTTTRKATSRKATTRKRTTRRSEDEAEEPRKPARRRKASSEASDSRSTSPQAADANDGAEKTPPRRKIASRRKVRSLRREPEVVEAAETADDDEVEATQEAVQEFGSRRRSRAGDEDRGGAGRSRRGRGAGRSRGGGGDEDDGDVRSSDGRTAEGADEVRVAAPPRPAPTPLGELKPQPPLKVMGNGTPPPFLVARGKDPLKNLDEILKHTGFFEMMEKLLKASGKPRETFQIVAKVDLLCAERKEEYPVSFVDPRLVRHVFDQLLDRGYRLLRVVDTTNEISRYQMNRSTREVGNAVGYDESCYSLSDLNRDLHPIELPGALGSAATGRDWLEADSRVVFAKNRTDDLFGPALIFYNIFSTMAVPTSLIAVERGMQPATLVRALLEELPVDYALIDAVYSRDGTPGTGGAFDLLSDPDGNTPQGASTLRTDTIIGGQDVLAVEAAGHRMQGLDPLDDECFKLMRKTTAYRPPSEVDELPMHPDWAGLGQQIRELLDLGKPLEVMRYGLWQTLSAMDQKLFPKLAGGWQHVRLRMAAMKFLEEVKESNGDLAESDVS